MGEWSDWCNMREHHEPSIQEYAAKDTAMSLELPSFLKIQKIKKLYEVTGDFETVYHSVWDIING